MKPVSGTKGFACSTPVMERTQALEVEDLDLNPDSSKFSYIKYLLERVVRSISGNMCKVPGVERA